MQYLYLSLLFFTLTSCGNNESSESLQTPDTASATVKESPLQNVAGSYVSQDYAARAKGYDWISVSILHTGKEEISIRIRSRADKKKPTCSLDAKATKTDEGVYKTMLEKGAVVYTFHNQVLTISPEQGTPEGALNYYCSGGAGIAGTYMRIEGAPDTIQMAQTIH